MNRRDGRGGGNGFNGGKKTGIDGEKSDHRRAPFNKTFGGRATTLFVTNFGDNEDSASLGKILRTEGNLAEMYIARKRNNQGNRFGFARFLDVKDTEDLVANLNCIRLGTLTLQANVARYSATDRKKQDQYTTENPDPFKYMRTPGRSYAEASISGKPIANVVSTPITLEKMTGCLIGRLASFETLCNIGSFGEVESCSEADIKYIGGLNVLISLKDKLSAVNFHDKAKEWTQWFQSIEYWDPSFSVQSGLHSSLFTAYLLTFGARMYSPR